MNQFGQWEGRLASLLGERSSTQHRERERAVNTEKNFGKKKIFFVTLINLYSCDILCDIIILVWQHLWRFRNALRHTFVLTLLRKKSVANLFYLTCCFDWKNCSFIKLELDHLMKRSSIHFCWRFVEKRRMFKRKRKNGSSEVIIISLEPSSTNHYSNWLSIPLMCILLKSLCLICSRWSWLTMWFAPWKWAKCSRTTRRASTTCTSPMTDPCWFHPQTMIRWQSHT